jgi:protein-S-isoprenylcysteine O-methyltransferase Ste14
MDTARYIIALLVLLGLPPAILLWLFIHPAARFWRKLGPVVTYSVLALPMVAVMVGVYLVRDTLLTVDYGTSYPTIVLGVVCVALAIAIGINRRKQLNMRTLTGIPELSRHDPGRLITDGLYARIRNPRYIELLLAVLGYACFSNYLAAYITAAICVPAIYLVVLLEERELRDRFGADYLAYCERVPRFIPRIGSFASKR